MAAPRRSCWRNGFEIAMLGKAGAGWLGESRAHDTMAGSRRMKVVWMRITAAGRKAITY
jgi:hypothetical protein